MSTVLESKIDELLDRLPAVDTSTAWRYADVAKYMKCSEATVRRMQKQPGFPKPREKQTDENGHSIVRFVPSEIIEWFESRAA